MNNEVKTTKELFVELSKQGLIKGFICDGENIKFQSKDGKIIIVKILDREMDNKRYELCTFDNFGKGEMDICEGHDTYVEAFNRIDKIKINEAIEHFAILEYGEDLKTVIKETRFNSRKEILK